MRRWSLLLLLVVSGFVHADAFDRYVNSILMEIPEAKGVKKIDKLTPAMMVQNSRVLPRISATFIVVRTNEGRMAKLLVQPAGQKVDDKTSIPILLVDRFVTYKEGGEQEVVVKGGNIRLFPGFRLSLDIGQIVPDQLPADLRFVSKGEDSYVEPVGEAELFLVTQHLAAATPKKLTRPQVGAVFEPRFFEGTYKLYDDGRRSGKLKLEVSKQGKVDGFFYSDKDGSKYRVYGKVGSPPHSIEFNISFPRTVQQFTGWMFTADGRAIAGYARMQKRVSGFYATRKTQD